MTPGGGVSSEIYREQVQKITELEAEKARLAAEAEEYKTKWEKNEEELEEFREGKGEAAIALEKSKEADKLVCDVIRSQLQLQCKADPWRRSRRSSLLRASYRSSGHRPRNRLDELQPLPPAKQSQSMT